MRPQVRSDRAQLVRDLLLVTLALLSVAIGIYQISGEPSTGFTWLDALDFAIVAAFWVDFVLEARRVGYAKYVRTHWWEVPSLIPAIPALVAAFPAVALVRALRLLRLARVISVLLRLRPAGAYVVRLARRARVDIILGIGAIVTLLVAVLFYLIESPANPDIATFGQATWLAFNLFTNVAYLDFQPVTLGGRLLAGLMQLCGIAFIGIFTASLAGAIMRESGTE
jgi:voltage-gated potassium channel